MSTITQIAQTWQTIFGPEADALAQQTDFNKRIRKLSGGLFAFTLVSAWLSDGASSLADLTHAFLNSQSINITRQGIAQRFTKEAALFMELLLQFALQTLLWQRQPSANQRWLQRFSAVWVYDSTIIRLPDQLAHLWPGTTGSQLKIQVGLDLLNGGFSQFSLHPGRCHDQTTLPTPFIFPKGALLMGDLGYFDLPRFAYISQQGGYWITRYKGGTQLLDRQGQPLELLTLLQGRESLDMPVLVGKQQQVPARLLARRLSEAIYQERLKKLREWEQKHQKKASPERHQLCRWAIYLTNLPEDWLNVEQVEVVYSLRWQIELVFKRWKSELFMDEWQTQNPWRILCEVYAKLLAALLEENLLSAAGCHDLAVSRVQAHRVIAKHMWDLARRLWQTSVFEDSLAHLVFCLKRTTRISTSTSSPPTFQKLKSLN